jgi:hypothetical protein
MSRMTMRARQVARSSAARSIVQCLLMCAVDAAFKRGTPAAGSACGSNSCQ